MGPKLYCNSPLFPKLEYVVWSPENHTGCSLSDLFAFFYTPFSMEGHISVTSQITGRGKSSLVSRYCRNYGFCSLTQFSNSTFRSWIAKYLKQREPAEQSGPVQLHLHLVVLLNVVMSSNAFYFQGTTNESDEFLTVYLYGLYRQ